MELEPAKMSAFLAAIHLSYCVALERIEAAERQQTIWKLPDFRRCPIVFCRHFRVFVSLLFAAASELVSHRQYQSALNARTVKQRDEIRRSHRSYRSRPTHRQRLRANQPPSVGAARECVHHV